MHVWILVIYIRRSGLAAAATILAMSSMQALAQMPAEHTQSAQTADDAAIDFAANGIEYDNDADVVTAKGDVEMTPKGNLVR